MSTIVNWLADFFTITNDSVDPITLLISTTIFTSLPFLFIISVAWILAAIDYQHTPDRSGIPFTIALIFSGLMFLTMLGLHYLTIGVGPSFLAMIADLVLICAIICCVLGFGVEKKK